jgi:hypothetical protein
MSGLVELIEKSTSPNDPAYVTPTIVGTVVGPGGMFPTRPKKGYIGLIQTVIGR